jgi:hypothetical protein
MGRTIPSFRIALSMEQAEWKPFCNILASQSFTLFYASKATAAAAALSVTSRDFF